MQTETPIRLEQKEWILHIMGGSIVYNICSIAREILMFDIKEKVTLFIYASTQLYTIKSKLAKL